jgi:hypothetical protein
MTAFRRRPIRPTDNLGKPCRCLDCQEAGVTDRALVRVPPDDFCTRARWLHGHELRAWYEARDRSQADLRALREKLRTR